MVMEFTGVADVGAAAVNAAPSANADAKRIGFRNFISCVSFRAFLRWVTSAPIGNVHGMVLAAH